MADRAWFTAVAGQQQGPLSDEQIREQITRGQVKPDTLVWYEGMSAWTRAGDIPGLIPATFRPPQHPSALGIGGPGSALVPTFRTWPLLGWSLLVVISQLLVIPTPWVMPNYYRWVIAHIQLPNGRAVGFAGKPGDIWYVFILSALCGYAGYIHFVAQILVIPLTALLSLIMIRWLAANVTWEGRSAPLRFTGGYWPYLGWSLLGWVALFTIIGWAWVFTAMVRWMCRHIEGSSKQLIFVASGWGMLWRTIMFVLSCVIIIPIPWTFRWFMRWLVSQFCLVDRV